MMRTRKVLEPSTWAYRWLEFAKLAERTSGLHLVPEVLRGGNQSPELMAQVAPEEEGHRQGEAFRNGLRRHERHEIEGQAREQGRHGVLGEVLKDARGCFHRGREGEAKGQREPVSVAQGGVISQEPETVSSRAALFAQSGVAAFDAGIARATRRPGGQHQAARQWPGGAGCNPQGKFQNELGEGLAKLRVRNLDGREVATWPEGDVLLGGRWGRERTGAVAHEEAATWGARGAGGLEKESEEKPDG
jgi:hypothetical protein